ncbi:MAG: InlB B-repeat-containing protein, partial [Clostridia bacterium]|nr:InlB B-repeat-containing protein [Clostridia bacterium]
VRVEIIARDEISGIEGYSFDGGLTWQEENSKEYTDNVEEIIMQVKDKAGNIVEETTSIGNITHEKPRYEVIFKNYDGTVLQTEQVEEGTLPEYKGQAPTKAEDNTYTYAFTGWDKEITEVIGNVEYVATYEGTYKNYTVVFKNEDGSIISSKEDYHYGDTVVVPANPTKAEDNTYTYTFAGWDKEITEVTGNVEYVATYEAAYKNYTVVFKSEDGSIISSKEDYHYGDIVEVPEIPVKEKEGYVYTFAGWGKEVTQVIESVEYIATFNEELIEYSISYELNGGTVEIENPTTYNVETENFKLNNPTRKYYKFIGWTLNEGTDLIEEVIIEKGSIGDRKYTANWELNAQLVKVKETEEIYSSIEMALEELEPGQTMILLQNITENITISEGLEVIIDLNGKTISNQNESQATITNKGILTIIDNSQEKTGKIENTIGQAIINEENAVLSIGNNGENVSTSPYVNGAEIGIKNNGTLNIYDGTIEGTRAIEGTINSVADKYNVVMSKKETEDGEPKQVATLGLMADSAAKIENLYYTSIEQAIETLVMEGVEEIPQQPQTTITILKNIVVTNQINIENYMNVRLDLNSNEISGATSDSYIINNTGKLEITDLSEEQAGLLTSASVGTIVNNQEGAELNISGGTISNGKAGTSSVYSRVISNEGFLNITGGNLSSSAIYTHIVNNNADLKISGGLINALTYTSRAVYNTKNFEIIGGILQSTGIAVENKAPLDVEVKVAGGQIKAGTSQDEYYGISNYGNVVMTAGEITGRQGIWNRNNSTITVTGGKIEATNHPIYHNSKGIANVENVELKSINEYAVIHNHTTGSVNAKNLQLSSGVYNDSSGIINLTDVNITSGDKQVHSVYNRNAGTINIVDTTIISSKNHCITNSGTGTVNIENSTIISNNNYGIYSSGTGTINLGVNDKTAYPTNYPNENSEEKYSIVKGSTYGVYNKGNFNFYDGVIFANTISENVIYGSITQVEEEYNIIYHDITADEEQGIEEAHYAVLGQNPVCRIIDSNDNILIDENGKEVTYTHLEEAFKNCQDGHTIQMIIPANSTEKIDIAEGRKIKLDLNGNRVTASNSESFISNSGDLEIVDSSENKTGSIISTISKSLIVNSGTLKINAGILINEKAGTSNQYTYVINNIGELQINGGKITAKGNNCNAIYNIQTGNVLISGGEVSSTTSAYTISNYGIMNMTGGKVGGYYGIQNNASQIFDEEGNEITTLKISGGTVETAPISYWGHSIINSGTGKMEITEDGENETIIYPHGYGHCIAVVNDNTGIIEISKEVEIIVNTDRSYDATGVSNSKTGTINIKEGVKITTKGYSVYNAGAGTINIDEANITSNSNYGIYNSGTGRINIDGASINAYSYGIFNSSTGTISVENGTVTSTNNYGINNSGAGKIVLGKDDGKVYPTTYPNSNTEENYPIIKGKTYGVYMSNGSLEFYDGIVFANTTSENAIYGSISNTASIYNENNEAIGKYNVIYRDTEEHYAMLGRDAICILLDSNGNIVKDENDAELKFYDLNDAIKNCKQGYTVKVITAINCSDIVEIGEDKSIKLDLNGQNITASNSECFIKNNGTLEILDSSEGQNSLITSTMSTSIIENNGKLIINGITISNKKTGNSSERNYVIKNNNDLTIENGVIESTGGYNYCIYNNGIFKLNNGTMTGSNGIYNDTEGEIKINNGSVTATGRNVSAAAIYNNKGKVDIENGTITSTGLNSVVIDNIQGTITINGGILTTTYKQIDGINNNEGIVNVNGGEIVANTAYSTAVINKGKLNISGQAKIKGSTGITNDSAGQIIVDGGEITGGITNSKSTSTIIINAGSITGNYYAINNSGKVTVNGGTIKTTNASSIVYGISNSDSATFNFNGGELYGKTSVVNGLINSIPEGKEIIKEYTEDEYWKLYLQDQTDTVQIGETTYKTIEEALNSEGNNKKLKLLKHTILINNITIPEDKNVEIDLNGYDLHGFVKGYLISNYGTIKIINNSENESNIISTYQVILNEKTATIENVKLSITRGGGSEYNNIICNNGQGANMVLNNITIQNPLTYINLIKNTLGDINIKGVSIKTSAYYTNLIYNTGNVIIDGGIFESTPTSYTYAAFRNIENGDMVINDIDIKTTGSIYNQNSARLTINGGTLTSTSSYLINSTSENPVNINGGEFSTTGSYGVISNYGANSIINIFGGIFEVANRSSNVIYNSSTGIINVEGGSIIHKNGDAILNSSTGTINIGKNDGEVLLNAPEIKSTTKYGVYNTNSSGIINFYDGAIIGKGTATYGSITGLPEGYGIKSEIKTIELIEGLQVYTLEKTGTDTSEASVNGIYYNSLQDAINACTNSQDVISLQRNIAIVETITIAEGQTITIDLNGFTITGTIENNGTLNITDTKGTVTEGSYGTITGSGTTNVQ